uniref:Putative secreted protein n=1 Tax=Ixodes ricinus TaxID=34613 RepID=A0A6B0TUT3_IXORI
MGTAGRFFSFPASSASFLLSILLRHLVILECARATRACQKAMSTRWRLGICMEETPCRSYLVSGCGARFVFEITVSG